MIIDIETRADDLYISYFNKAGEIDYISVPLKPRDMFNWEEAYSYEGAQGVTTWDDKPVKKANKTDKKFEWKNPNREFFRLSKYRIEEILAENAELVAPAREYNKPKKHFIDIETEVTDGFPDAESAENRVLTIAIANDRGKIHILGLEDLTAEEIVAIEKSVNDYFEKAGVFKRFKSEPWIVNYIKFNSEYDMLYTFFSRMVPKMSCLTGWNFIDYDWKYLINRCAKVSPKIDPAICSVSARLHGKNRLPLHRLVVDYLEIYKKWDRSIKIKESNKLDYVAEKAIGVGKIKYGGNLKDLYTRDFFHFVFYNAIDAALIHYLDQKLNTMSTFLSLAHVSQVEINKAFSPIWQTEAMMTREFLSMNKVFLERKKDDQEQKEFEGAYVKQPVIGMHHYVTCYDFASLYPNTMMQFNISPETYCGKKNKVELRPGEILTASGAVFLNDHDSVLRKILKNLYSRRKSTKGDYLQVEKEKAYLQKLLS